MVFTVSDFQGLLRILDQHPEWREELRRRLLTDELLALPAVVRDLAERMDRLAVGMEELAKAQASTQIQLNRLGGYVGRMAGSLFEMRFAERAPAYMGHLARRLRPIVRSRLADLLEDAVDAGQLTREERDDALSADLVLSGRRREDGAEAYFVVEASIGVGTSDVGRAKSRAAVLAKLGRPAVPVVAGAVIDELARQMAEGSGVVQLVNPTFWPTPELDIA